MTKSTKEGIRKELYELLQTKALDDITVTELVERCGISRQAFYYHFSDLYAVAEWSLQQAMEKFQNIQPSQWWEAMQRIMEQLYENRTVVLNVYRAYERSYVEHNLRRWLPPSIRTKVEAAAVSHQVTHQQREFVIELCAQGLANVMLSWIDRGMNSRFSDRLEDFYAIMEGSMDFMLERLAQRHQKADKSDVMSKT